MSLGDIISLTAPSGNPSSNVSIGSFSNLFSATFTPDAGVPEPATWALFGDGIDGDRMARADAEGVTDRRRGVRWKPE